ncbi:MAG: hypothetical protein JWP38_1321 [Herbaspirillum sp.]|nr:hypothetical protein [Herbaspirillum sp.]
MGVAKAEKLNPNTLSRLGFTMVSLRKTNMKRIQSVMLPALLLALFPPSSRADVGNLGGLVQVALTISGLVWVGLTVTVFVLLRRRLSAGKRVVGSVLFFFAPVLFVALASFKEYAFGEYTTEVTETTREPLAVAGTVFPAGSRAHYEQTGGFFGWRAQHTLLDIHSARPVWLGTIRIEALTLDRDSDQLTLNLSGDQVLNGWLCAGGEYTLMWTTPKGLQLDSCWLAASREWHGETVPAGTYVSRNGEEDDWLFAQMPKPQE